MPHTAVHELQERKTSAYIRRKMCLTYDRIGKAAEKFILRFEVLQRTATRLQHKAAQFHLRMVIKHSPKLWALKNLSQPQGVLRKSIASQDFLLADQTDHSVYPGGLPEIVAFARTIAQAQARVVAVRLRPILIPCPFWRRQRGCGTISQLR